MTLLSIYILIACGVFNLLSIRYNFIQRKNDRKRLKEEMIKLYIHQLQIYHDLRRKGHKVKNLESLENTVIDLINSSDFYMKFK